MDGYPHELRGCVECSHCIAGAGGSIRGTVRLGEKPAVGVSVKFMDLSDSSPGGGELTDIDGNFEVTGLAPAPHRVAATLDSRLSRSGLPSRLQIAEVEVSRGSESIVDFVFEKEGGTLEGYVTYEGTFVDLGLVSLISSETGEEFRAIVEPDGFYSVSGISFGQVVGHARVSAKNVPDAVDAPEVVRSFQTSIHGDSPTRFDIELGGSHSLVRTSCQASR